MRYDLRPRSFIEILDQSFRVLRDNFVGPTCLMAIFNVPYALSMSILGGKPGAGFDFGATMLVLAAWVVLLTVFPLGQAAAIRMVADAYLGVTTTLPDALRASAKIYAPYTGTFFLMTLACFGLMFLLFVPAFYFGVCWTLIGCIAVIEGVFGRAAMRRSRWLVRDHWGRTALLLTSAGLINVALSSGISFIASPIPVLGPLLSGLVGAVGGAYLTVVVVVLYFDLRCRKEDFDLTVLTQQLGQDASSAALGTAHA